MHCAAHPLLETLVLKVDHISAPEEASSIDVPNEGACFRLRSIGIGRTLLKGIFLPWLLSHEPTLPLDTFHISFFLAQDIPDIYRLLQVSSPSLNDFEVETYSHTCPVLSTFRGSGLLPFADC